MIYLYVKGTTLGREGESLAARELLFSALEREFSLPRCEILKDEKGKPYFKNEDYPAFSISHTDGAVAVAISRDFDALGVDIQRFCDKLSDTRLTDRFFGGLSFSGSECQDIKLVADGEFFTAIDSPITRFTLGEAIIKCDGRGFSASSEAPILSKQMKKASFNLSLSGIEYSLSLAVK
jgi:phosphopantetheinyl transferase